MTPEKRDTNKTTNLEDMLSRMGKTVSDVKAIAHALYEQVDSLSDRTDSIYDILAHHRDIPVYDPDDGSDFLDALDE